ncbi:hypothetical protein Acor_11070 [Acrocarpospora corrugata]|uniref:Carboxypeptidase regulatory-like domain-containing protein n=1 Tax=Acrocarpospora corrugata TaxID=35763 RepID=A0A5M3VRC2_9ACTN|nr:hypothetical protein [Acrocarpospora corrugata]GER99043.1 hypothetical protein Acor_11070 [Acrocarpospora corrugata]
MREHPPADEPSDQSDDVLMAELAALFQAVDGVPAEVLELGRAVFTWQHVDAELAELTYDSGLGHAAPGVLVRAEVAALRDISFESRSGVLIEIGVTGDALQGQLIPPRPGEVRVVLVSGRDASVPVDEVGGFTIRPIPLGRFRLHFRTPDGVNVVTSPISL